MLGLFLPKENLCYSCPKECSTCKDLRNCQTCNDGYILFEGNKCIKPTNEQEIFKRAIIVVTVVVIIVIVCCAYQQEKKRAEARVRMKERKLRIKRNRGTTNNLRQNLMGSEEFSIGADKDVKTVRWLAQKRVFKEDLDHLDSENMLSTSEEDFQIKA